MSTTNTVRITFTTTIEGEYFVLSLTYADPALKEEGGLATVQAAATAIITQQPFIGIQLSAFSSADFVERTVTEIDV